MIGFKSFNRFPDEVFALISAFKGWPNLSRNVMLQNVSESKAESNKITHNFFVLEDGRSNSLLQTYKLVALKEI